MTNQNARRGFTQIKRVGQALPDNAPAKGHLAAFTLIELLVVVLIIGILAAVALPQYQKAVMKTQIAEYEANLAAIAKAAASCKLQKGTACTPDELDIEVPECKYYDKIAKLSHYSSGNGTGCVYAISDTAVSVQSLGSSSSLFNYHYEPYTEKKCTTTMDMSDPAHPRHVSTCQTSSFSGMTCNLDYGNPTGCTQCSQFGFTTKLKDYGECGR